MIVCDDKNYYADLRTKSIYDYLVDHPGSDRDDLVAFFHIPRTTMYDCLKRLMNLDLIRKHNSLNYEKGRPRVKFTVIKIVKNDYWEILS